MTKEHVGALLVKDKGRLLGIITERDLVTKAVAADAQPSRVRARQVMTAEDVRTVPPEADIFEALSLMRDYEIRHLPVVHEGRLLGLVTMKDILKIEPDLFDLLVAKLDIREEERKPVRAGREHEGTCDMCGSYSDELKYLEGVRQCPECRSGEA
jgi:signal-transduction protein with cAMP-binding, CBS, and nucleotidyltransferase domain